MKYYRLRGSKHNPIPGLWLSLLFLIVSVVALSPLTLVLVVGFGIAGLLALLCNQWTSARVKPTRMKMLKDVIRVALQAIFLYGQLLSMTKEFYNPEKTATVEAAQNAAMSHYLWIFWFRLSPSESDVKVRLFQNRKIKAPLHMLSGYQFNCNFWRFTARGCNEVGFRFYNTIQLGLYTGNFSSFGLPFYLVADMIYCQTSFTRQYYHMRTAQLQAYIRQLTKDLPPYTSFQEDPPVFFREFTWYCFYYIRLQIVKFYAVFWFIHEVDRVMDHFRVIANLYNKWCKTQSDEDLDELLVNLLKRPNPQTLHRCKHDLKEKRVTVQSFVLNYFKHMYKSAKGIEPDLSMRNKYGKLLKDYKVEVTETPKPDNTDNSTPEKHTDCCTETDAHSHADCKKEADVGAKVAATDDATTKVDPEVKAEKSKSPPVRHRVFLTNKWKPKLRSKDKKKKRQHRRKPIACQPKIKAKSEEHFSNDMPMANSTRMNWFWVVVVVCLFLWPVNGKIYRYTSEHHEVEPVDNSHKLYRLSTYVNWVLWYMFEELFTTAFWFGLCLISIICSFLCVVSFLRHYYCRKPYKPRKGLDRIVYWIACHLKGYGPCIWKLPNMSIVDHEGMRTIVVKDRNRHTHLCWNCNCTGHTPVNCPMNNLLKGTLIAHYKYCDVSYALENHIHVDPEVKVIYNQLVAEELGRAPVADKHRQDSDMYRGLSAKIKGLKDYEDNPTNDEAFELLDKMNIIRATPNILGERMKLNETADPDTDMDESNGIDPLEPADDDSVISGDLSPFSTGAMLFSKPAPKEVFGQRCFYKFECGPKKNIFVLADTKGFANVCFADSADELLNLIRYSTGSKKAEFVHCEFRPSELDITAVKKLLDYQLCISFTELEQKVYYTERPGLKVAKIIVASDEDEDVNELIDRGNCYLWKFREVARNSHLFFRAISETQQKIHFIMGHGMNVGDYADFYDVLAEYVKKHNHVMSSNSHHVMNRIREHFAQEKSFVKLVKTDPRDGDFKSLTKGLKGGVKVNNSIKAIPPPTNITSMTFTSSATVAHNAPAMPFVNPPTQLSATAPVVEELITPVVRHNSVPLPFSRPSTSKDETISAPVKPISPSQRQPVSDSHQTSVMSVFINNVNQSASASYTKAVVHATQNTNPFEEDELIGTNPFDEPGDSKSVPNTNPFEEEEESSAPVRTHHKDETGSTISDSSQLSEVDNTRVGIPLEIMPAVKLEADLPGGPEIPTVKPPRAVDVARWPERFVAPQHLKRVEYGLSKKYFKKFEDVLRPGYNIFEPTTKGRAEPIYMLPPTASIMSKLNREVKNYLQLIRLICDIVGVESEHKLFGSLVELFETMPHDMRERSERVVLPGILQLARNYFEYFPQPIEILQQYNGGHHVFTSDQIACLNACQFLCMFPFQQIKRRDGSYVQRPTYNFFELYNIVEKDCKVEKLKCIYNYFDLHMAGVPKRKVLFARTRGGKFTWSSSPAKLCNLNVCSAELIQDEPGTTHVDFANRFLGGGVLNTGAVQEELMFCQQPELFVTRLFTEALSDLEAFVIVGSDTFSKTKGYGRSFAYAGPDPPVRPIRSGFALTEIVAIDAVKYGMKGPDYFKQYDIDYINRELDKAYVGFKTLCWRESVAICTGFWGCGAYHGDKQLKAMIQLIAASVAGRDVLYKTVDDPTAAAELFEIWSYLRSCNVSVGMLYSIMLNYRNTKGYTLYKYIMGRVKYMVETKVLKQGSPPGYLPSSSVTTKALQAGAFGGNPEANETIRVNPISLYDVPFVTLKPTIRSRIDPEIDDTLPCPSADNLPKRIYGVKPKVGVCSSVSPSMSAPSSVTSDTVVAKPSAAAAVLPIDQVQVVKTTATTLAAVPVQLQSAHTICATTNSIAPSVYVHGGKANTTRNVVIANAKRVNITTDGETQTFYYSPPVVKNKPATTRVSPDTVITVGSEQDEEPVPAKVNATKLQSTVTRISDNFYAQALQKARVLVEKMARKAENAVNIESQPTIVQSSPIVEHVDNDVQTATQTASSLNPPVEQVKMTLLQNGSAHPQVKMVAFSKTTKPKVTFSDKLDVQIVKEGHVEQTTVWAPAGNEEVCAVKWDCASCKMSNPADAKECIDCEMSYEQSNMLRISQVFSDTEMEQIALEDAEILNSLPVADPEQPQSSLDDEFGSGSLEMAVSMPMIYQPIDISPNYAIEQALSEETEHVSKFDPFEFVNLTPSVEPAPERAVISIDRSSSPLSSPVPIQLGSSQRQTVNELEDYDVIQGISEFQYGDHSPDDSMSFEVLNPSVFASQTQESVETSNIETQSFDDGSIKTSESDQQVMLKRWMDTMGDSKAQLASLGETNPAILQSRFIEDKVKRGTPLSPEDMDFIIGLSFERQEMLRRYYKSCLEKALFINYGKRVTFGFPNNNSVNRPFIRTSTMRRIQKDAEKIIIANASKYMCMTNPDFDEIVWDTDLAEWLQSRFDGYIDKYVTNFRFDDRSILPYHCTDVDGPESSVTSTTVSSIRPDSIATRINELRELGAVTKAVSEIQMQTQDPKIKDAAIGMRIGIKDTVKFHRHKLADQIRAEILNLGEDLAPADSANVASFFSQAQLRERVVPDASRFSPSTRKRLGINARKHQKAKAQRASPGVIASAARGPDTVTIQTRVFKPSDAVVKPVSVSSSTQETQSPKGSPPRVGSKAKTLSLLHLFFIITLIVFCCFATPASAGLMEIEYVSNNQTYACLGDHHHFVSDKSVLEKLGALANFDVVLHDDIVMDYACQIALHKTACFGYENENHTMTYQDLEEGQHRFSERLVKIFYAYCNVVELADSELMVMCEKDTTEYVVMNGKISDNGLVWKCGIPDFEFHNVDGNEPTVNYLHNYLIAYHRSIGAAVVAKKNTAHLLPPLLYDNADCTTPLIGGKCQYIVKPEDLRNNTIKINTFTHLVQCHYLDDVCHSIVTKFQGKPTGSRYMPVNCDMTTDNCIRYNNGSICYILANSTFVKINETKPVIHQNHWDNKTCEDTLNHVNFNKTYTADDLKSLDREVVRIFGILIHVKKAGVGDDEEDPGADYSYNRKGIYKTDCVKNKGKRICVERFHFENGTVEQGPVQVINGSCDALAEELSKLITIPGGLETLKKSCNNGSTWVVPNVEHFVWFITEHLPDFLPYLSYPPLLSGPVKLTLACSWWSRWFTECLEVKPIKIRCGTLFGVHEIDKWFHPICQEHYANLNVLVRTASFLECENNTCKTGVFKKVYESNGTYDFDLTLSLGNPVINVVLSGPVSIDQTFYLPFAPTAQYTSGYIDIFPNSNFSLEKVMTCHSNDWTYQNYSFVKTESYWRAVTFKYKGDVDEQEVECFTGGFAYTLAMKAIQFFGSLLTVWAIFVVVLCVLLVCMRGALEQWIGRFFPYHYMSYLCDLAFYVMLMALIIVNMDVSNVLYWVGFFYAATVPYIYFYIRFKRGAYAKYQGDFTAAAILCAMSGVSVIVVFNFYGDLLLFVLLLSGIAMGLGWIRQQLWDQPWDYDYYEITPKVITKWFSYCEATYGDEFEEKYRRILRELKACSTPDLAKLQTYYELNFLAEIRKMNDSSVKTKVWKKSYQTTASLGYAGLEATPVKNKVGVVNLEAVVNIGTVKTMNTPDIDGNLVILFYGDQSLQGICSGDQIYIPRHLFINTSVDKTDYQEVYRKLQQRLVAEDLKFTTNTSRIIRVTGMDHVVIGHPVWIFNIDQDNPVLKFDKPRNNQCTFKAISRADGGVYSEETTCTSNGRHYANTQPGDCGGVIVQRGAVVGFHIATHEGPISGLLRPLNRSRFNIFVGIEGFLSDDTVDVDLSMDTAKYLDNLGPLYTSTIIAWFTIIYIVNKRKMPVMSLATITPRTYHADYGCLDRSIASIQQFIIDTCRVHGVELTEKDMQYITDYALTALEDDFMGHYTYCPISLCNASLNCLSAYQCVYFNLDSALSILVRDGTSKLESVLSLPSRRSETWWHIWFGDCIWASLLARLYIVAYYMFIICYQSWYSWGGIVDIFHSQFLIEAQTYALVLKVINMLSVVIMQPFDCLQIQFCLVLFDAVIRLCEFFMLESQTYFNYMIWYWYLGPFCITSLWSFLITLALFSFVVFVCICTVKGYYFTVDLHTYVIYAFMPLILSGETSRKIGGAVFEFFTFFNPSLLVCIICWTVWGLKALPNPKVRLESSRDEIKADTERLFDVYHNLGNQLAHSLRRLPTLAVGRSFLYWFDQHGSTATVEELRTRLQDASNEIIKQYPGMYDEYLAHSYLSDVEIGNYLLRHYNIQTESSTFLDLLTVLMKHSVIKKFDFGGMKKLTPTLQRGFLYWLNAKRASLNRMLIAMRTMPDGLDPSVVTAIKQDTYNLNVTYMAYSKLYRELVRNGDRDFWTNAFTDFVEHLLKRGVNIDLYEDFKSIALENKITETVVEIESIDEDMLAIQDQINTYRDFAAGLVNKADRKVINIKIGELERQYRQKRVELNKARMEEQAREISEKKQTALQNILMAKSQNLQRKARAVNDSRAAAIANMNNCFYYIGLLRKSGVNYDEVMQQMKKDFEGDYNKIWRHLNRKEANVKVENCTIANAKPVVNDEFNVIGYVTPDMKPILVATSPSGEMRTNIKDITPRDTYFAVEGTFYPYGYSSIEAYFTNEVTTGCTVPMVSPCGVALNCSRTGRHSKLLCSGAFRNELETHMNACDACMGMFLTGKLTHGNCGQSIRTSRIFDYIRAVLLCPGCNPCTSCGGIARTGEDPHCLNASWHGIVCRNRKCGGCTLDHPPVVTLENYEMNAIPFGSINKLTVTKDGDTWSYFLSEDGTARKVAHIGAGPPAGFVKLSREAMKNVTTRDVYVVPEIFQQGQFFNFVSNLKNLTLESIRCNSCNKACARACYDLQHPIVCTKTEDKADVLYLNDIITLKEYINLCGQDFLDHASATASDGTLYRAGGCPRKDPAHKALCGLHGVNDILVPLSVPSALHRLYIHTYGLARHCQVCKGAMWSNDCLFCQDYAKPEPEIEFEPEEKSETIHDHDRKRSSSFSEQKLAKVARRIKQGNEIQQAFNPVLESDEFTPNQKLLLKTVLEALTKNLQ